MLLMSKGGILIKDKLLLVSIDFWRIE